MVHGVLCELTFNEYGFPGFVPVVTTDGAEARATIWGAKSIWEGRGIDFGHCEGLPIFYPPHIMKRRGRGSKKQYPESTFYHWEDGTVPSEWEKWYHCILQDRIGDGYKEHVKYHRPEFKKYIKAGLPAKLVVRRQAFLCDFTKLPFYQVGVQPEADYPNGAGYIRIIKPYSKVKFMRYEDAVVSGRDPERMVTPSLPDNMRENLD